MPAFLRAALGALLIAGPVAGPASAGVNRDAQIVLHLVPAGQTRSLCKAGAAIDPETVTVIGDLDREYLAYVLVTGFDQEIGITGVQFGISYEAEPGAGVDVLRWQRCSMLEFQSDGWPRSGTGNLLTWAQNEACRHDDPVVVGVFRITAKTAGRLALVPRPVDGIAALAACGPTTTNVTDRIDHLSPENLGWVGFGGEPGHSPSIPAETDPR